jgi:AraC-like DNA-binding protein
LLKALTGMFNICVEFQNIDDFVPEIAKELKIGFQNHLSEYSLQVPKERGEGVIKGIQFPNGIALYNFSCSFKQDTKICSKHLILNPIRIVHCLEGYLGSQVDGKSYSLNPHQYTIISPRGNEYHSLLFEKDIKYQISLLEVNRTDYVKSLPFEINDTDPLFYNLFHNSNVLNGHLLPASFNLPTSDVIKEINNCRLEGFPRINFLGAKALEMLSNTLQSYQEEVILDRRKGLTELEYKSVSTVADEINNNIGERKTNAELAKLVGWNVNKLQSCFQQVYGKTVNEYIRDVRLSRALDLLQEREKNINEIVYAVGLNSHSYFSRVFKEKYGISPRDLIAFDGKFD